MPTTLKSLDSLKGKYIIFSRPGWWKVSCTRCSSEWRLDKKPDLHPGNLLRLIDHYAGHEAGYADPEAERRRRAAFGG